MCVSSILIAVVLCLYSKISVVVVNNFFLVGFFFLCKNNCCIIPINWNFGISTSTNMSAFHINMFWNFSAFALLHCKYLSNPQTPFQYI